MLVTYFTSDIIYQSSSFFPWSSFHHLLQHGHDCCCFLRVKILGQPYMTFLLQFFIQFTLLLFSSVLIYPLLFHPFLASPSFPSMLVSIFLQSALHLSECFLLQIESLLQHLPLPLLLPILLNSPHWCSLFFMQLWSTCFVNRPYSKWLSALFLGKCPSAILLPFHHLLLSGTISLSLIVSLACFSTSVWVS